MAQNLLVALLFICAIAAASAAVDTTITSKVYFDIDINGKDAGEILSLSSMSICDNVSVY